MTPTLFRNDSKSRFFKGMNCLGVIAARAVVVILISATLVAATESVVAAQARAGIAGFDEIQYFSLFLATLAVAAILGLGWALTNRLLPSLILLVALLTIVTQAHERKNAILAKALAPWDLFEVRQILALFPTVAPGRLVVLVLVLCLVVALTGWSVYLLTRRPRWPLNAATRIVVTAICGLFLYSLADWRASALQPILKSRKVINVLWDSNQNIERNGLLLSLVLNARSLNVYRADYSQQSVVAALGVHQLSRPSSSGARSILQGPSSAGPDVILYMGEALWDPTMLGVRFSRDPIPNFRQLWHDSGQRTLLSPAYGGGTANAEFEILTGIPMAMLPEGSYPYQHYVSKPLESLASIFRNQGYKTLAVHPFYSWFWARNAVYPLMGFENFVSLEAMEPAPREGPYPSDGPLVARIVHELNDEDSRPLFAFAISVVTHGPYLFELLTKPRIKVLDELHPNTVKELENYATLLSYADGALGQLIAHLKKRDRPTILIIFGDHLPALGIEKAIYRETGFLDEEAGGPDQKALMARVPIAIWSNVPDIALPQSDLGMPFLGQYVLRASGARPEGYFALLADVSTRMPVLQKDLLKANGVWYRGPDDREVPSAVRTEIERIFLLGYDRLLGSGFSQFPSSPTEFPPGP